MSNKNGSKKKKSQIPKVRNWLAVQAFNRKAGPISDKKKERSKKACRKKYRPSFFNLDLYQTC